MQRDFGTTEQETMSLEQLAKAILSHMEPIHDSGDGYAIYRLKTKYAFFEIHTVYGQWDGCEHEHDDTWPECRFGFCYADRWLIGPVTIRKR